MQLKGEYARLIVEMEGHHFDFEDNEPKWWQYIIYTPLVLLLILIEKLCDTYKKD